MDGKVVNHEPIRATNVYVAAYIFIFAASFFLISLDDFDMVTNFTAIAATLNNIGPGLNQVGPMMNFGSYSNPAKLVMIFDMLAGRLELYPMLALFAPRLWRTRNNAMHEARAKNGAGVLSLQRKNQRNSKQVK